MRKFTLILLSVLLSVGAWAETVNETIYSFSAPTAPTEALEAKTGSEVTATYVNGTAYIFNGHASNPAAIVYSNGINLAGSGASYFKLTIADGKLAVGDVIDVTDGTNSLDKSSESTSALYISTSTTKGSLAYNFPYTIKEEDITLIGSKELYFWKNGVNFFRTVSITRTAEGGTEDLSFTTFETSATPSFTSGNVNVVWSRGGGNISADTRNRGIRMQENYNFTITVPTGAKISQVQINWGSNGNLQRVDGVATGNFLDASITNASDVEVGTLTIPSKVASTIWNAPYNVKENVLKFTQTGKGDIYIASLQVTYYNLTLLPATVTFSLGGASATVGTVPAEEIVEPGNSLTIPINTFLYKEGYTLTGWTDGENTYAAGETYTPTADATLTAVFTANMKNIATMEKALTLRWPFAKKDGCQEINMQGAGKVAYIIRQAKVDGEMQDLALKVDVSAGKFNNTGRTDEWAQVNGGTVISFPSSARATITSKVYQDPTTSTLDGEARTDYTGGVATWAANPTGGISTLTVADGLYYSYIEVNIPRAGNPWDYFQNVKADFTNGAFLHSDETTVTTFGIKRDGDATVRCATDDDDLIATVSGKYHSDQHGLQNFSMTIAVPGSVKITAGACGWGSNLRVTNAEGTFDQSVNTKLAESSKCFHQDKTNNVVSLNYTGSATTLTISGGTYLPYIAVEAIATITDEMTEEAMDELDGFTGAVTVNRSLTAGMFNTICLPFNMSDSEISATFGATCELKELSEATLSNNELVLNFTDAAAIVAGKPYLIMPETAVTGWTMENVTLSTTTHSTVTPSVDFIGVLTPTELTASENTLCVGAGNTLFYVGETSTMKGLRGYFTVKGAAAGVKARISMGGQVATNLENANVNADANKLIEQGRVIIRIDGHDYDLNGHLLK